MKISKMNVADDIIHITSYEQLRSYTGRIVDMFITDRRSEQVKHRVHKHQLVSVVENPKAMLRGVILAPFQSVKASAVFSRTADFELNTVYLVVRL